MEIKSFNKGDRVRVVSMDSHDKHVGLTIGHEGTVISGGIAGNEPARVAFDNFTYPSWVMKVRELELIEPKPEPIGVVTWVRPKSDNNIVNSVVRVLAKVGTAISNVAVSVYKFIRGIK